MPRHPPIPLPTQPPTQDPGQLAHTATVKAACPFPVPTWPYSRPIVMDLGLTTWTCAASCSSWPFSCCRRCAGAAEWLRGWNEDLAPPTMVDL